MRWLKYKLQCPVCHCDTPWPTCSCHSYTYDIVRVWVSVCIGVLFLFPIVIIDLTKGRFQSCALTPGYL